MTVRELLEVLKDANPDASVAFEENGTRYDIREVLTSRRIVLLTEWDESETGTGEG